MRRSRELFVVGALAVLACARVEILAVAFPFFGTIDEQAHVDLVRKFARGYWPRRHVEPFDRESVEWFVAYGTFEYLSPPGVAPPPLWRLPREQAAERVQGLVAYWRGTDNFEKGSPPLYYFLLGLWLRLCAFLGLSPGAQLYCLRLPNGIFVAAAVLLTWRLAKRAAPDRPDLHIGAPLLLALLPQDVFYFVNCDTLSLPLGAAALLCAIRWLERPTGSWRLPLMAGLVAAAAVLTKLTNLPTLLVLGATAAVCIVRQRNRRVLAQVAIATTAAALPLLFAMARNHRLLGDWTGDADKAREQGFTRLGLHGMLAHPLFTPSGAWTFVRDLVADLWRGEVLWHGRTLGASGWDVFYVLSSLLFLAVAAVATARAWHSGWTPVSAARALCWLHVVASIGLLAFLSISFDYGSWPNPSREHPYFTAARHIAGSIPAFLVLYAWGAGIVTERVPRVRALLGAGVVALVGLAISVRMLLGVIGSGYNWLHWP